MALHGGYDPVESWRRRDQRIAAAARIIALRFFRGLRGRRLQVMHGNAPEISVQCARRADPAQNISGYSSDRSDLARKE